MPEPREEWGRRVRERREALQLRQEDVAETTGIQQGTLSKIERGQVGVSYDVKLAIADALTTSVMDLFPYVQAVG